MFWWFVSSLLMAFFLSLNKKATRSGWLKVGWFLVLGIWNLVLGIWYLVFGIWNLAAGCWPLAVIYWLLKSVRSLFISGRLLVFPITAIPLRFRRFRRFTPSAYPVSFRRFPGHLVEIFFFWNVWAWSAAALGCACGGVFSMERQKADSGSFPAPPISIKPSTVHRRGACATQGETEAFATDEHR